MATTNDLKNGLVLNLDGQLWTVTEFQHVKPGKGGAFVRTTLKNVLSGKVVDKTFNAGTKVETATVDKRAMTYLYKDGADYVFMDGDTYDQIHVPAETVGDGRGLPAGEHRGHRSPCTTACRCTSSCRRRVELVVQHTDPGLQGDRSTGGTKPATLETGAEIQVPLFVNTGDKLKVDTRDGRYLGRVKLTAVTESARWPPVRKARKRALDVLYAADLRGRDRLDQLADEVAAGNPPVHEYTVAAGRGRRRARRPDRRADRHARRGLDRWTGCPPSTAPSCGWRVYELLWADDVPDAVVIDEAVELAKTLSTDDSPRSSTACSARSPRPPL